MKFPGETYWQVSYLKPDLAEDVKDDGIYTVFSIDKIISFNQFKNELATLKISLWLDCEE